MAGLYNFPSQKKTDYQKTKNGSAWGKGCVNAAHQSLYHEDNVLRKSFYNKTINYNLYSDILDPEDVKKTCNPYGFENESTPGKMQNYPIMNPKIDLLYGEEVKRHFNWNIIVTNENAVSDKERKQKELLNQVVTNLITKDNVTEKEIQDALTYHQKYMNYTWKDLREQRADQVLRYLWEKQDLKMKMDTAYKDVLIAGEEIGQWDIVAGEPVFTRLNPKNVHVVRSGESSYVEDADIIVVDGYYSPGQIIDHYHDVLTPTQVAMIDNYFSRDGDTDSSGFDLGSNPDLALSPLLVDYADRNIDTARFENGLGDFDTPFDNYGNIKVIKVYWKSMRKMKRVKYFDEQGDEQEFLMPDSYKIDKDRGEEEKEEWISEWWEGHKISSWSSSSLEDDTDGIYLKIQPRPVQFRSMENPSLCHPGIIGTIYNTNDNRAMSLVDRMKPYQYMYNALYYNVELLIAANWGRIMKVPVHEIPEGWDVEQWLWFAKNMKAVPYNAFKEGKKGAAQGKLAGQMQQNSPVLDMEQGNTIQMYIQMMAYIKQELGEISGVSAQRLGQIEQRELVGNVERSVSSSSNITEYWSAGHNHWKKRVLTIGLETAKIAWQDKKNKKLQFVADDTTAQIATIDVEDFVDSEYGIFVGDSRDDTMIHESLKQLAQAGLQNDKINFSDLMTIMTSTNSAAIRRTLEASEMRKEQAAQQNAEQAERMQSEQIQAQAAEKEAELANVRQVQDMKNQGALDLEMLKQQGEAFGMQADRDADGIPDEVEAEKVRTTERIDMAKMAHDSMEKDKFKKIRSQSKTYNKEDLILGKSYSAN